MNTITVFVDGEKLANGIISDIKKKLSSLKSHRKPNQSRGKALSEPICVKVQ
jgi:hypothetical protein